MRTKILNRCVDGIGVECGSNFGSNIASNNVIALVAPGAQVVAGMVAGTASAPQVYVAVPPDPVLNGEMQPPSTTGLGVDSNGVHFWNPSLVAHGPMTGTSMSAPHVTAAVGLMRSINPLLSTSGVRAGLSQRANQNVPGYTQARMGAGLLNARHAVENAAGQIRGTYQRNRLAPVFSMYAAQNRIPSEAAPDELFVEPVPIHAWIYTTNPQLAVAASRGDIYWNPDQQQFGPTTLAAYLHSHELVPTSLRTGVPISEFVYQLPSGAGKSFRTPATSFYVFTTPHSPLPGVNLQALYRLTTDQTVEAGPPLACAGSQRKHLYTTDANEVVARASSPHQCNASPLQMRYQFESIEGYVYDRVGPQPAGTQPLFRVFNNDPAFNVAALVVAGQLLPGYTATGPATPSNPHFLGWVYRSFKINPQTQGLSTDDQDNDGLIDGLEGVLGLNEQTGDGDCDGVGDAAEYGFANLPSDPMSPSAACVDARVTAVYSAGAQTVTVAIRNPVGPAAIPAGVKVQVHFTGPANGPVELMGGGGPQCISLISFGWNSAYECTVPTSLPPGPNSAHAWTWTQVGGPLFLPGQNSAAIRPIAGLSDPVAGNNATAF